VIVRRLVRRKADLLGAAQRCVTLPRDPHKRGGGLVERIGGALQLLLRSGPARSRILRFLHSPEGGATQRQATTMSHHSLRSLPKACTNCCLSGIPAARQEALQRKAHLLDRCDALLHHLLGDPLVRQGPLRVQPRTL
jgi:hypothetical protein